MTRTEDPKQLFDFEPNDPLEAEWNRQARNYLTLGFNEVLGQDGEEYLHNLPHFSQNTQEQKRLGLTIPLLVDPRVYIRKQMGLAGIGIIEDRKEYLKSWGFDFRDRDLFESYELSLTKEHFVRRTEIRKTTDTTRPYSTWIQDGSKYLGKSPFMAGQEVVFAFLRGQSDERIGSIYDGISLAIQYPQKLRVNELIVLGTQIGKMTPTLISRDDKVYLGLINDDSVVSGYKDRGLLTRSAVS